MPRNTVVVGAIIGSTLMALSLVGSSRNAANFLRSPDEKSLVDVARFHALGKAAFSEGRYQDAHEQFRAAATAAMRAGSARKAAMNWSNAGFACVSAMQYRCALEDLTRARTTAEDAGEMVPLLLTFDNLASLYLQMGVPEDALSISRAALAGPAGHADKEARAKLFYQQAQALAMLGRLPEAEPIFRQALAQLTDLGDFDAVARGWAALGADFIDAERYADAEAALNESLHLVRHHGLKAAAYVLTKLAELRGKEGDPGAAERLFAEALDTHESVTPLWVIYYERGHFRLETGNTRAALDDFREARQLALRLRADIVPADQERVGLENRVNRIFEGLVDAGNRVAQATGNNALLAETFDAAEQDRLWSLRSLVPGAALATDDWRSRLPANYWELLLRFQAAEGTLLAAQSVGNSGLRDVDRAMGDNDALWKRTTDLELELQQAEAAAGAPPTAAGAAIAVVQPAPEKLPSRHAMATLDRDSVLFSFSLSKTGSWLWTVDRQHISVYRLPPRDQIVREVSNFTQALRAGGNSTAPGRTLYKSLFGAVPAATLNQKRWLFEPDGPLYDLPFAALPVDEGPADARRPPTYLIERAALQAIPGALLMERGKVASGAFVGVGDPVFNAADPRYRRDVGGQARAGIVLPRLPNTAEEVTACSRAWGSNATQLLTGSSAGIGEVESALSGSAAVIHFATHVVTAPGEFGSGLIALGLDGRGAVGLLGPGDIAARRVSGALVVMNGCHSGQGDALPGSGMMGLTRAWIGAGARAVVSTRWDVPDDTAQSLMVDFYRSLRGSAHGNPAGALRIAQLAALHSGGPDRQPSRWAGYFLLSRI